MSETERGRGWTQLGMKFQYQGDFQEAMSAYESALLIFEKKSEYAADYALALSSFGTLYRDMLEFDASAQMQLRALHVDQQINDHGGMAIVCADLADLELGMKRTRKAQAWLAKSVQESKLAPTLDNSYYAFVASSEAWLAVIRGNTPAAIAGYQKEIDYLTHTSGEQKLALGWAYMLLGKAFLRSGNINAALSTMRKGCSLLPENAGTANPRYLLAQIAYSQALDAAGMHAQAAQTKADAEQRLRAIYKEQCTQCRITALALH